MRGTRGGGQGERQHAVVLQQDDALAGHVEGQLLVLLGGDGRSRNPGPPDQRVRVEVAQLEAGDEQAAQRAVEVGLADVAATDGSRQVLVLRATLHVRSCQHGLGRRLGTVACHVVPFRQEVADGAAVAGDKSLESPFVAQDLLFVARLCAAGLTVNALVGTHHLRHLALLHQRLEGWQVGLPEVALGQVLDVELVAVPLRTAVYGEVLGAGQQLHVFAVKGLAVVGIALQTANHGQAHLRRQEGVFAVGLLTASPAWVAEDVDIRCPERQALVALYLAGTLGLLCFDAGLVADGREHLVQQLVVP